MKTHHYIIMMFAGVTALASVLQFLAIKENLEKVTNEVTDISEKVKKLLN